jgi:3D (Asp-Asp-Asp) domain-containing protein
MRPWPALATAILAGCVSRGGRDWVEAPPADPARAHDDDAAWIGADGARGALDRALDRAPGATPSGDALATTDPDGEPLDVRLHERSRGALDGGLFRNTYYDFPVEQAGAKDATIYDASCKPIAKVTIDFHDRVCVQGSGRLEDGGTVSFARRDCACAAVCPRTGQRVCFERLDPRAFPSGRGATGKPITPLSTVAVDSSVIPLGTVLFVPELAGLPTPSGARHSGCFVAEDRGIRVVGRQIDVFTGDPSVTAQWNSLVPSNQGVHVLPGQGRCPARVARER